jgi:uncharacterized protein
LVCSTNCWNNSCNTSLKMNKTMKYGLSQNTIERIQGIFSRFPEVEEVVLYGSRAKGTFRSGSDVDFALKGKTIPFRVFLQISSLLDDLMLPFTFDLLIYEDVENPALLDQIDRYGQLFYSREKKMEQESAAI